VLNKREVMSQQQQQREETNLNEAKKMFFNSFKPTSSDKSKPFTSSPLPGSDLQSVSIEMSDRNISSDNVSVKVIGNHSDQSEAIDANDVEKALHVTESDSLLKDHHDFDNSRPSMTKNASNETTKAVQISNLYFSYGKEKVLRGLDLNVNAGTIYGLLGASGCGKKESIKLKALCFAFNCIKLTYKLIKIILI
jgi:ABC-type multidrug transport system fused ATPase/permease subunit